MVLSRARDSAPPFSKMRSSAPPKPPTSSGAGLLVHAKDEAAQGFYRKFGFESSPVNDLHLYLLMKDILANQGGAMGTPTPA